MLIRVQVVMPTEPSFAVTGALKVFDRQNTVVYQRANYSDLIPVDWKADWLPGEMRELVFYWNGITDDGKKAYQSSYNLELTLEYMQERNKITREIYVAGGVEPASENADDRAGGWCGTGALLAFFPLLFCFCRKRLCNGI